MSCTLVPPAGCHDTSHCAAATSCPLDNPPTLVCKCLPSCIGLLFASWLSGHPCCHTTAASCPLNMPPPPCNKLPPPRNVSPPLVCWRLSSHLPLFCRLVITPHLVALPPQVSILDPPLHLYWLVVESRLVTLLPPSVLSSTPTPLDALATHFPFASRSPQLVACVFDLACPISQFMAICQGYVPTYLHTTGGGGVYPIRPYAEKQKIGFI